MSLDTVKYLRFALWFVELQRENEFQDYIQDRIEDIKVSYYEHGQADDFELTLDNTDKFFSNKVTFKQGDEARISLLYADRALQDMGLFTIDDIIDEAPPSLVRISGLASDTVAKNLRTLKTKGFENTSLERMTRDKAAELGYELVFKGEDISINRKEQKEEHDLRFLTRLAEEYGFNFKVQNKTIYFIDKEISEGLGDLLVPTFDLKGIIQRRSFRYKSFGTYKKSEVRYQDPVSNEFLKEIAEDLGIDNVQELKATIRAENRAQAKRIAKSKLKLANQGKIAGEIECMGMPELKAPLNVLIQGEGDIYDGTWHIEESHHQYEKRRGYTVRLVGYKLGIEPKNANVMSGQWFTFEDTGSVNVPQGDFFTFEETSSVNVPQKEFFIFEDNPQ